MKRFKIKQTIIPFLLLPVLGQTAAFHIYEQGANSLGYAHADMASLAEDASTVFFNPAGMTRFDRPQFVAGAAFGDVRPQFDGYVTFPAEPNIVKDFDNLFPTYIYSQFLGSLTGEATMWSYIPDLSPPPSLHIDPTGIPIPNATFKVPKAKGDAHPIAPYIHFVTPLFCKGDFKASAGCSVAVPFGLESDFSGTYVQPYAGDSNFAQITVNPALALRYKNVSLGVGLDYMFLKDFYSQDVLNVGTSIYLSNPSIHRVDLSSRSRLWTWNIGALIEFDSHFRIGVTYRAPSDIRQKGDFNCLSSYGKVTSLFKLPDYLNVGFYLDLLPNLGLMGDFGVTFWDRFKNVTLETTLPLTPAALDGTILIRTQTINFPFHYKKSYFGAMGLKYTVDDDLIFKFGLSIETSPTTRTTRELRIPDNTRYGIATGVHYDLNCHLAFDIGYEYLFFPKTNISNNPLVSADVGFQVSGIISEFIPNGGGLYNGSIKTQVQIFSMQLSWTF